jgi:hypothetical protein
MTDGWMDDDGGLDGGDSFLTDVLGDPNQMDDGLPQPRIAIPGQPDPGADGDDGRDGEAIGGGGQDPNGVDGTDLGGKASRADLDAAAERESDRDDADTKRVIQRPTGQHKGSDDSGGRGGGHLAKSFADAARGIGRDGPDVAGLPDSIRGYVGTAAGRKQLKLSQGEAQRITGKLVGRRQHQKAPVAQGNFEKSSFEATLNKCEFLPSGEMRVVFIVPDSESDEAVLLRHAYACSIRVSVERLSHAGK